MISKYNNKNFLFTFAQNGQEALNLFKLKNKKGEIEANAIKLIFMDIEMPFMNGEVCSQHIKNLILTNNYEKCTIIGCSANSFD